jgi:hypothetical protein
MKAAAGLATIGGEWQRENANVVLLPGESMFDNQ